MLNWFRTRGANTRKSKELYGAVVAEARRPELFRDYGLPDTVEGRYEAIVLILFVVLERLRAERPEADDVSRLTLEALFTDMDDCMREMGVGDLTVPKKVRKSAAGFYERAQAYRGPLAGGDSHALGELIAAFVASNPPRDGDGASNAGATGFDRLARYAIGLRDRLAASSLDEVVAGRSLAARDTSETT